MNACDYKVIIPESQPADVDQDGEFCIVKYNNSNSAVKIGFHQYGDIYAIPGLYEHLFYDRLECASPQKVCSLLADAVGGQYLKSDDIRALDLGAGNGIVGEQLRKIGINHISGIDIIKEAKEAARRDRPDIYQAYYVADLTRLSDSFRKMLVESGFNLMTTVGTLGFGDIPVRAFSEGFNMLSDSATVAFNIKETFLSDKDLSGFSALIQKMIERKILEVTIKEKYRHRFSVAGKPLYYIAVVGSKRADIPEEWFKKQNQVA